MVTNVLLMVTNILLMVTDVYPMVARILVLPTLKVAKIDE
jgi:hypothetical protein